MPSFQIFEQAVIAGLAQIHGISAVGEFVGDVSTELLRKAAPRNAGLLLIALGGSPAPEQPATGQLAWSARYGVFIVTRNARGSVQRTRDARALAQGVMLAVRNNQWGLAGVHGATIERLENRSAGKVDDAGYGLWLLIWKQVVYLDDLPADEAAWINDVTARFGSGIEQVYNNA